MTRTLTAAALLVGAGPASAACFDDLMADAQRMISTAEQKGDSKAAAEGKKLVTEAKQLHDAGNEREAMIRIVRYMDDRRDLRSGQY
jgi:hypothetical protein